MRLASLAMLATCIGTLIACDRCYALCAGTVAVQLAEVPAMPYEVSIELPDETVTWTCDVDTEVIGADCEGGYFDANLNDSVESAAITVEGVTTTLDADCEKNKVCGTTCWRCSFFVD